MPIAAYILLFLLLPIFATGLVWCLILVFRLFSPEHTEPSIAVFGWGKGDRPENPEAAVPVAAYEIVQAELSRESNRSDSYKYRIDESLPSYPDSWKEELWIRRN